jgi:hypothetical protein
LKEQLPEDREDTNILLNQMNRLIGVHDIGFKKKNGETICIIKDSKVISVPLDSSGSGLKQIVDMYPHLFAKGVNNAVFFI